MFDAFYYEDKYWKREGRTMDAGRWTLPESFHMDAIPYTTDFVFAFFDAECGMFFFYEQSC